MDIKELKQSTVKLGDSYRSLLSEIGEFSDSSGRIFDTSALFPTVDVSFSKVQAQISIIIDLTNQFNEGDRAAILATSQIKQLYNYIITLNNS